MPTAVAVLNVESDEDLAEMTRGLLERFGFQVTTARSFEQAEHLLRHRAFDVIIGDLLQPGPARTGCWAELKALRSRAPMTPFGLVSGTKISAAECAEHGLAFALLKPVAGTEIVEAIGRALPAEPLTKHRHATVRMYFASLERADWDLLESLCTEAVRYELPADDPRLAATVEGRAAFRRFSEEVFSRFREPRFAMQAVRALPQGALVRYEGSWCDVTGGRTVMPGAVLFRFAGDHIAEIGIRVEPPDDLRVTS